MSADTIRHKSNSNYDIDDFINQLLSSQKFDELAEKVADKAASKIKDIEVSPPRLERFIDENKVNKSTDVQQNYRDYDKEPDAYNSNFQLRNDSPAVKEGKIDTHAVMDETTSHSEDLKLKYKYLTRNAYEKKIFNDRATDISDHNSLPRNDKKDDTSMQNVKKIPEEYQDHLKTEGRDKGATEKNQHNSKNDFESGNRWRHELRDEDRKDSDSNRESKHSNTRNDRAGDRKDHSREDLGSRHEQKRSGEVQNSRPEFKSVVKGQVDKKSDIQNGTIEEEPPSSVDEHHTDNSVSAEKTQESIQGEVKENGSDDNVEEEEPLPFQFRARADSYPDVDENKVTSVDIKQEHQKVLDENSENSSRKPIIRREGDKLFTFVEAPEYAEYHQEMAKLIKDKEKSPEDFLVL